MNLAFLLLLLCPNLGLKNAESLQNNRRVPAPPKPPTKTKVTTSTKWIQKSLETHNFFRSLHDTAPLVLNNTLSEISQYYANYLLQRALQTLDNTGIKVYFEHNPETGKSRIGENLYYSIMRPPVEPVPSQYAVLLWYEEIKDYDFKTTKQKTTSDPKAQIGHLTQVLWKGTKQMGTAYSSSRLPDGRTITFVVANYYPGGNYNPQKYFIENVVPAIVSDADVKAAILSKNIEGWWEKPKRIESDTPVSWRNLSLNYHNDYRNRHNSQPLRLNKDICGVSQRWAEYLLEKGMSALNTRGVINQMEPNYVASGLCDLGENSLYFVTAESQLSPEVIIKSWIKQKNKSQKGGRTIKQDLAWKETTEFCMSYASKETENGQYLTYVVANYYPASYSSSFITVTNPNSEKMVTDNDSTKKSESVGCCSPGTVFGIIFAIFIVGFFVTAVLIYKHKKDWYDAILLLCRCGVSS